MKYRNILFDKDDTTAGSGIPYGMCSTFMFGGFRCPDEHFECVEDAGSNPYVCCSSAQEYLHLRFSCFNARTTHYITNFALKHRYMGLIGFDNIFQSVRGSPTFKNTLSIDIFSNTNHRHSNTHSFFIDPTRQHARYRYSLCFVR